MKNLLKQNLVKLTAVGAVLASLAIGSAASAQDYYHDSSYRHFHHGEWDHYNKTAYYGWHDHSDWRRGGYVARGDWDRGDRVDYNRYHLRRPPSGYEWRRVNGNFVLVALASGLIADMVNGY